MEPVKGDEAKCIMYGKSNIEKNPCEMVLDDILSLIKIRLSENLSLNNKITFSIKKRIKY